MFFKKIIHLLSALLFVLFFFPSLTFAETNFSSDYNVFYTVNENGVTKTQMNVTLTNLSDNYHYIAQYKIQLGFNNITDVTASDPGGQIIPEINKISDGNTITLNFNNKAAGKNSKQTFNLYFNTTDVAHKQGNIWEINIPGVTKENNFNTFNVDLKVPASFGKAGIIKPQTISNNFHFTKEQLVNSGISVIFGEKQLYEYQLLYHLKNTNLFPISTEIALPPQTNYQDVYLDSISPEPVQVKKDGDGNWLAEYQILPAKQIVVEVKGRAAVYLKPKQQTLALKDYLKYLSEKPYWQVKDNRIIELARKLKTPQAIYDYVTNTLQYDYSKIAIKNNRLGALRALNNPKSVVCLEFTDLFITLARAAGIPAREVNGYAYASNAKQRPLSLLEDVLHAWPEYYDQQKQTWIMVDPTWGNTTGGVDYFNKLDFDHLTFVIKGLDSTYPIPAGGYKDKTEINTKEVFINFAENDKVISKGITLIPIFKKEYIAGLPIEAQIKVINKNAITTKNILIEITGAGLSPKNKILQINELLPYENRIFKVNYSSLPILTNNTYNIKIISQDKTYNQIIVVKPFLYKQWTLIGGFICAIFTFILFIITIKTRNIHIFKQKK